jgi:hypothetical protein
MSLRNRLARLARLEARQPSRGLPDTVVIDIPGQPDRMHVDGQWLDCADWRAALEAANNANAPCKLYIGWNPETML